MQPSARPTNGCIGYGLVRWVGRGSRRAALLGASAPPQRRPTNKAIIMFFYRCYTWVLTGLALLSMPGQVHALETQLKSLPGHVPGVVATLQAKGRLPATNQLALALGLPLRDPAGLDAFLREVYDPASPHFHQYLSPAEFTARFGPTEEDYAAVEAFARTNGWTITRRYPNRMVLDVTARVTDIERALHLNLRTYRHPTEPRDFYAPETEPTVPKNLPVLDISGLSDFGRPKPMLHRSPATPHLGAAIGSSPGGGYLGKDFRNAYAPGSPLNGFGQMVGLVELSGYDPNDIFAYEAQGHLPNVPLLNVLLDGSVGDEVANGDSEAEVCLDIEMAIAMAPNLAAVVESRASAAGMTAGAAAMVEGDSRV